MTHLLDAWPAVAARLGSADKLLLALDFDGTLAPIVARPEDARIPLQTAATLRSLESCPNVATAIVTGRGAADVRMAAGLADTHYLASHGRQRIRPGNSEIEEDSTGREVIREVCERLAAALADIDGFVIENKGVSAAAHFRNADPQHRERVERSVREAVEAVGSLDASEGKMVFDITPADGIDKGVAVSNLLTETGGLALYFGDDTTDETAFRALPRESVTVFVGPEDAETNARFRLADPTEVGEVLGRILDIVRR